jgi:hypothetical protein
MFRAVLLSGGLVVGAVIAAPTAQAESCAAHLAKHGVTKAQDIADHASGKYRGESPCKGDSDRVDNSSDSSYTDSGSDGYRRDKFGFNCGIFGCG